MLDQPQVTQRQYRSLRRSAPQALGARIYPDPRLKLIRAALLAAVLILVSVVSYRTIVHSIALQQQRRQLEAEASERARHPLYYRDIIEANARQYNLDPSLIAAVMLCESSFEWNAESGVGARGLMQLMPDTAQWVAGKLGESATFTFDQMYSPETNVRYGSWYLGYLSRRFEGDFKKIVSAYHAGQGNVDAWLRNPKYSADGVKLDTIPTDDTKRYADRVLSAQAVYDKIYYPSPEPIENAQLSGGES